MERLRICITAWATVVLAVQAFAQHYQYRVLIGDRDAERGVLYYDYPSGNFGALGICAPSPTASDFYYGIAVHPQTGEIWVCNVLRNRIDVLDQNGNCLRTIPNVVPAPHGIAIHPQGNKVVISNNTFFLTEYDIPTGQWRRIVFAESDGEFIYPYLDKIYGIRWHPSGQVLYAAAIGGVAEVPANGELLTNAVRCFAGNGPIGSSAWDVAAVATGQAGTELVVTDDVRGPRFQRVRFVGRYQFGSTQCTAEQRFAHPEPDAGGLLFGIERAPDGTIWLTNYERGLLYQLEPSTGRPLRRVQVGNQKVGVGIAIIPRCETHNGDVNQDGCIDDADLLAVLFLFGSTGTWIREDVNCDGAVDDADLLIVLFNFGAC